MGSSHKILELIAALTVLVGCSGIHWGDCICDEDNKRNGTLCPYCRARAVLYEHERPIANNTPHDVDAFVCNGTMFENFKNGAWFKEKLDDNAIKKGLLFRPNSNVPFEEFLRQKGEGKRYCITFIGKGCKWRSFIGLSHDEAKAKIKELYPERYSDHESYINIYNMEDAITLMQYEKELARQKEGR